MAFDATIGGPSSSSYITVEQADGYFANHINNPQWTALTLAEKQGRLMQATQRLEWEDYLGDIASTTQALKFPRYGLYDWNDRFISNTVIPYQLIAATAELAISFQLGLIPPVTSGVSSNPSSISLFDVSISLKGADTIAGLPTSVLRYLRGFIQTDDGTVRLVRS